MEIVRADLPLNGDTLKAVLHAPKNGLCYVIDRRTCKLVSAEKFTDAGVDRGRWRSPERKADPPTQGFGVAFSAEPSRTDGRFGSLQAWDPV